jgi:hypothetical protein
VKHGGGSPTVLQVARDRLELFDGRPLLPTDLTDRRLEAVIYMVVDERPLGFRDRLLDRVQLLGSSTQARPPSIIVMVLRRWPSARLSRLTTSGWVW